MTDVTYEAEFVALTSEGALECAKNEPIPFKVEWSDISVERFWRPVNPLIREDDDLETKREKEWVWVATVKAKGHL